MKLTKSLIIIVLFICFQNLEARGSFRFTNYEDDLNGKPIYYNIAKRESNLRGVRDVWNKIKENAISSWNYIKTVAEKTKVKLDKWIKGVKEHANNLEQEFKEKLEELKDKVYNVIKDIYGTGELVKQCMEKERGNMEGIMKEIMKHMAECIAEEISKLTYIKTDEEPHLTMNQTQFLRELDNQYDLCERDMDNVNECLCKVRENIFDTFTGMEEDILRNHFLSRSIVDDVKGTLVTCSMDNLVDATNLIVSEIIEIAKCVMEVEENEENPTVSE